MSRAALCCTVVCGIWSLFGSSAARAQEIYLKEDRPFNTERQEALEAGLTAEPGPPTDAQVQAAEVAARFLVYRLTDPRGWQDKPPRAITGIVEQCNFRLVKIFAKGVSNPQMQVVFRNKMLEALGNVLAPEKQFNITRVNATRVLARLAELSGHEETADLLLKVLTDPKQVDGARYWAFKGLKGLLLRQSQTPPAKMDAKRREKIAEALVQFIERKPALEKNAPPEELDGLRVMRREAVRTLAQLPEPLFAGNPKAHTALALLRVLRQDKQVVPEPRLDEQVEAAIGLAQLRADAKNDYQPGYVAYHLAHFLLELAKKHPGPGAVVVRDPWKIFGARLGDALKGMQAAFPADATVKQVAPAAIALARSIELNNKAEAQGVIDWLMANPQPPQPTVYKNDPKSVVEPRPAPME